MFKQKKKNRSFRLDRRRGAGSGCPSLKKHPPSPRCARFACEPNAKCGDAGQIRPGVPVSGGRYPMFVISFVIFPCFFFRLVFSTQIPRRRHVPELGISLWLRRLGARGERPEDGPAGADGRPWGLAPLVSSPGIVFGRCFFEHHSAEWERPRKIGFDEEPCRDR